jgi:alpha-amylase
MLSDEDKIGQLTMLSESVTQDFGQRPTGMWLAERVWEPSLARPIAQAGLKYALVDDTHFNFAGYKDDDLFGYYVTEDQGYPLNMFPSSKDLRYLFPWKPVDEAINWLRAKADQLSGNPTAPPPLSAPTSSPLMASTRPWSGSASRSDARATGAAGTTPARGRRRR